MARPKTGRQVTEVTLTLSEKNLPLGRKIAHDLGISFSELVDRGIALEIEARARGESILKTQSRVAEVAS